MHRRVTTQEYTQIVQPVSPFDLLTPSLSTLSIFDREFSHPSSPTFPTFPTFAEFQGADRFSDSVLRVTVNIESSHMQLPACTRGQLIAHAVSAAARTTR